MQEEIHEQSLGAVRLKETLFLLQNTPDEDSNLWAVVRRYIAAAGMGRRAYRSQEGQDVDLPDATALQVGDGGLFLRLVVWRHFGECRRLIVVQLATRGRQARKICGLRLFHPAPWPTRARRSQEKLAQQLGGEISEGIGVWRRFGQQQPCREPREIGDWRLDVEELADFTLLCLSSPSSSSTSTRRLQCDDTATRCDSVAQYLQWPHRTRRFVPWSRRHAALCVLPEAPCMWGRCCCCW